MGIIERIKMYNSKAEKYVIDNEYAITGANQRSIKILSLVGCIIMGVYWIASYSAFSEWNVSNFYMVAFISTLTAAILIWWRYGKKQKNYKELVVICSLFQWMIMMFVGVMSIYPVELDQPAVYFTPISIGFCVCFIYEWKWSITLLLAENLLYLCASYSFKELNVFYVDLFSGILAIIMGVYILFVLYSHRINESENRDRLSRIGMIDALTNIYNKNTAESMVSDYLNERTGENCALFIMDIDNFKNINDKLGHMVGDKVLTAFGTIVKSVYPDSIAGRIGGDEFMLFLKNCKDEEEVAAVARSINKEVNNIRIGDAAYQYTCSIGVYYVDREDRDYSRLYGKADTALYYTKNNGKNGFAFYSQSMNKA